MVEIILTPLEHGFFVRGLTAGIITAITCGALSGFVVWRGMSFIGDALAHAILPGIVIASLLGVNLLAGALAAAIVAVLAIGAITQRKGMKEDTAIGVIFTGAFSIGILLLSKFGSYQDLTHILFGNILGVFTVDLLIIGSVGLVVVAAILLFYKEFLVTSFDTTHAIAIGLSPLVMHYLLLLLIAVTTVITAQTVGVILVLALLVTPAAAASLLVKTLPRIILLSIGISILSVITGFYISWYFDFSSGAVIVVVLTALFSIVYIKDAVQKLITG